MKMAEKMRGLPLPYLKAWRIKKFIGQGELADMAKLARATVTRAERGDEVVSFANIRKLAEALGITPDQLLKAPDGE
jgi:transcriptional regulator with XRE-family HTH domain